jgi:spore coat polysaccharide biosynthesis predicted glycosyltransferase SpsG
MVASMSIECDRLLGKSFFKTATSILADKRAKLGSEDVLVVLSPYMPGLHVDELMQAIVSFKAFEYEMSFAIQPKVTLHMPQTPSLMEMLDPPSRNESRVVKGLLFFRGFMNGKSKMGPVQLRHSFTVISTVHDFWAVERQRHCKNILMRVIGHSEVGSGHIHRALTVAKMLIGNDISFICRQQDKLAVDTLANYQYPTLVVEDDAILNFVKTQKPDLFINDTLEMDPVLAKSINEMGIKQVAFETFGPANQFVDLVVNEIVSGDTLNVPNHRCGHEVALLREEVLSCMPKPNPKTPPSHILITFGGSDPRNYTMRVLQLMDKVFLKLGATVTVVLGIGFSASEQLSASLSKLMCRDQIVVVHNTDNIAKLMCEADFAFCSNGRTVFELAHLSVPAFILCQNERELTHDFASGNEGLRLFGIMNTPVDEMRLLAELEYLLFDTEKLQVMRNSLLGFDFLMARKNLHEAIKQVLDT